MNDQADRDRIAVEQPPQRSDERRKRKGQRNKHVGDEEIT